MFLESGRTAFSACVCAVVVLWAFYYASHDEHWNDIVEERMILAERIYARRERLANPELYKRKEASPRPSIWKGWSGTREGSVSAGNSKKSKRLGNIIERISVEEKVDEEKVAMSSGEVHKSMQSFAKGSGDAVVEIPHRERHESNTPLIAKSSPIPSREDKFGGSRASSLSMTSVTAPTTRLTPEKTVNSGKTANAAAYIDTADMKSVMKGLRQSVTARSGNNTFLHERKLELKIMILFDRPLRIVLSGVAIAISVLAMHHIGISSIQMEATYEFNAPLVLLSAIVALVASITGMFIIFRVLPYYPYDILKVIAAFLISFAVNGMHYCGMGALTYKYAPNPTFNPSGLIDGSLLADNVMYIEVQLYCLMKQVAKVLTIIIDSAENCQ
ncbi:hypothetical protein BCR33DRAFT_736380 [Rhizoclosmatium globosum]|uniref:MHYT domain-containing protein n=1 Tax=Rhizoclosmatium globosum TaxID=329046 RepID=A0A1Y2CIU2_9FUNG|nr:hypothetical protein BCR33DRAFT_736380 [Rhizoclosmatium globosum]|eukprot:ORY46866.1 hypothetical protein BCR33DRAFT_736380 [Rhizoclosmatium globosum]